MPLETIELPITGKIIEIKVSAGDTVRKGDVICLVESMKMENPIVTPVSGTVKELPVSLGQLINTGDVLAVIEY